MAACCGKFMDAMKRRKYIDMATVTVTNLRRCLSTFDLACLGIGSTLGAGIYVVAGQVARETAGPSVILSFAVAAFASVLAGLCYAEFGARVPKTGSAYVYSYVTVGELWAFIIGWNLILEYVIGTASVARAWSSYFDSLIGYKIQGFFLEHMPMDVAWLSSYPDFFAFGLTCLLAVVLAIGVKESSRFNNFFTGVNLLVVAYVCITGLFKIDFHNWNLSNIPEPGHGGTDPKYENGKGGFFAFGFSGMMSGAATCFYAFVGFDIIATTGEECKNPQRAIPISIITALVACFLAYFGVSAVITLMCPYYLIETGAPLPAVFSRVGWDIARYIISVGAVCGLSTSLLGAMFPLPRVIYAMASDGLLFRFLARVNQRFKTPLIATIISGVFAGVMAMMFDLKELVDMMSIGTLLAYTLVAACVLILRYDQRNLGETSKAMLTDGSINNENVVVEDKAITMAAVYSQLLRPGRRASNVSSTIVGWGMLILCAVIVAFCCILIFCDDELQAGEPYAVALAAVFGFLFLLGIIVIWRQPQNTSHVTFKLPGVPFVPILSCFINLYLMLKLSAETWIRFGVWMLIGFAIYFGYGVWKSSERSHSKGIERLPTAPTGISIGGKEDHILPASNQEEVDRTTKFDLKDVPGEEVQSTKI